MKCGRNCPVNRIPGGEERNDALHLGPTTVSPAARVLGSDLDCWTPGF